MHSKFGRGSPTSITGKVHSEKHEGTKIGDDRETRLYLYYSFYFDKDSILEQTLASIL